jgi:NADPH-dependent curcumin reductase CurA
MPQNNPLNRHTGAQVSAAITTNTTTVINLGRGVSAAGVLVNTAGSAWTAAIWNGNPTSGGILLVTISADAVGPVVTPLLRCPQGLYVVTAGTTAGSLSVAFFA